LHLVSHVERDDEKLQATLGIADGRIFNERPARGYR